MKQHKLVKPVDADWEYNPHIGDAVAFAKKNCKRNDEVGNLARVFLMYMKDNKMAQDCMAKAALWLSRAQG